MSLFYRKFLLEDAPRGPAGDGRDLYLAAFGKHPGWNDHIEDIGIATESLILTKQLLYLQGIGGQIDTGAWEKLPVEQQIPQFHHAFVWQRSGRFLLGQMWSSSDGKGRTRYPMVVCAHAIGLPLDWLTLHLLPEFERIQHACMGTRSAHDVVMILGQSQQTLRRQITQTPSSGPADAQDWGRLFARPEWGAEQEAFLRVLHQFRQQADSYREARRFGGNDYSQVKPQQIRVPVAADSAAAAILLWEQFIYLQLPPDTPSLLLLPLDLAWVDITIGEPSTDAFFCLRASAKSIPLASTIPYRLEPDIKAKGELLLAAMRRNGKPWLAASEHAHPSGMGNKLSALLASKARKVMEMVRGS